MKKNGLPPDAVRLRHLRLSLGYTKAAEFARFLGISKARWSNFENGYPLPREMIYLLCEKIDGLTSDYIYFGRAGGLPVNLARLLGALNGTGPVNGPAEKRQKKKR